MKKIILKSVMVSIGLLMVAFVFTGVYFQYTGLAVLPPDVDLVVVRDLSSFQELNQEFQVVFDVTIRNNATAIIIEEYAPNGANITGCSEADYRVIDNKIEILLFNNLTIETKNVTYTLIVNSINGLFNGTWNSIDPDLSGIIQGDIFLPGSSYCGDTTCNSGEDCSTCAVDCGVCSTSSGGGSGGGGSSSPSGSGLVIETPETPAVGIDSETPIQDKEVPAEEYNGPEDSKQGFFRTTGNFILGKENERLTLVGLVLLFVILTIIILIIYKKFK